MKSIVSKRTIPISVLPTCAGGVGSFWQPLLCSIPYSSHTAAMRYSFSIRNGAYNTVSDISTKRWSTSYSCSCGSSTTFSSSAVLNNNTYHQSNKPGSPLVWLSSRHHHRMAKQSFCTMTLVWPRGCCTIFLQQQQHRQLTDSPIKFDLFESVRFSPVYSLSASTIHYNPSHSVKPVHSQPQQKLAQAPLQLQLIHTDAGSLLLRWEQEVQNPRQHNQKRFFHLTSRSGKDPDHDTIVSNKEVLKSTTTAPSDGKVGNDNGVVIEGEESEDTRKKRVLQEKLTAKKMAKGETEASSSTSAKGSEVRDESQVSTERDEGSAVDAKKRALLEKLASKKSQASPVAAKTNVNDATSSSTTDGAAATNEVETDKKSNLDEAVREKKTAKKNIAVTETSVAPPGTDSAIVSDEQKVEDPAEVKKRELREKMAKKKAAASMEVAEVPNSTDQKELPLASSSQGDGSAQQTHEPPVGPSPYSTPELAEDAAKHKAGLSNPDVPEWQNPLHHNNSDSTKIFREDFATESEFENAKLPAFPFEVEGKVTAPEYLRKFADEILSLNMMEMNELANRIADHFGFHEGMLTQDDMQDTGSGGVDDSVGSGGGEPTKAVEPEKTTFDVKLVSYDDKNKIKIIKEVRAIAGLNLKEAKEAVEGAPKVIQKGLKKEAAEEIKSKLEELGAKIELS